jgi:cobalt-zinc-cadmium efflux system outer membrane protein
MLAGGALVGAAQAAPPLLPVSPVSAASSPYASVAPRLTMAHALAAAWDRSLESAEAAGRQRQVVAEQGLADAWLAAAPSLNLSQREGLGSAAAGARETELAIALPLWRPGQRGLNAQVAQAESDWAVASERATRLQLATRLREQAAQVKQAEAAAMQAAQQRQTLQALCTDVERRVRAGDLAPTDAMAAQAEMLAARSLALEAERSLAAQRSTWTLLTSMTALPEPEALTPRGDAGQRTQAEAHLEAHPEAQLAAAAVARAQQRVAQVQAQRGAAPELGLGMRQEQPGSGQPRQGSVALSLSVPFGTDAHNAPRLAAALAELGRTQMSLQRAHQQLEAELGLAHGHLNAATDQAAAQAERARLLHERARLLTRSFQAGESSLPELLRALSSAAQADADSARQHAALAQAQARIQHALGQLP